MNQATASIGQSVSSLVSDFSLIADIIGAIAGIIGDIEMSRMITILGRIEVSTRGSLAQLISLQGTLNDIDARLDTAGSFEQGFWPGVMAEALTDLGEIVSEIAAGGFGGGGGSGSDAAAIAVLLANLQNLSEQVTNLDENLGEMAMSGSAANAVYTQQIANINSNTGAVIANTAATTSSTAAIATLATTATGAAASFTGATVSMIALSSSVAAATQALAPYVGGTVQNLGPGALNPAVTGTQQIPYSPGSVSMVPFSGSWQYGPNSSGYQGDLTGVNQYPNESGGVNLNVTITGNSITSQALVDQLAQRVGAEIITNLRTRAGLKLG